jgi:hypothetical protein
VPTAARLRSRPASAKSWLSSGNCLAVACRLSCHARALRRRWYANTSRAGPTVHADESGAWDALHASYPMLRVNHSREFKGDDDACTNQAESWFSRLRRAEMGVHHRISGKYLYQYANEMAWREDNRRIPNGTQWRSIAGAALRHPMSEKWRGYWNRSAA